MWNLFKIEFLKYRNHALIVAVSHFVVLAYLTSLGAAPSDSPLFNIWMLAIFSASFLFGMYQIGSHKRGNFWIYLIQRPLPARQILMSISAAGLLIVVISCILPFFLMLLIRDTQGIHGIEFRHYFSLMLPIISATAAYLLACQATLSPHRLAYIAALAGFVVLLNRLDVNNVTAGLAIIAWVVTAMLIIFKADYSIYPTKLTRLVILELGIWHGLFWLYALILLFAYQVIWSISSKSPVLNPTSDTAYSLLQKPVRNVFLYGLEKSDHVDKNFLARQIAIADVMDAGYFEPQGFPVRHQRPSLDNANQLQDPESNTVWTVSHSAMMFEGIDPATQQQPGWLGPDGFNVNGRVFDSLPRTVSNNFILDDRAIYQLDWRSHDLVTRFSLKHNADGESADTERFVNSLTLSGNVASLQSDRALYLFRSSALNNISVPLEPDAVLELSAGDRFNSQIWVAELAESYLVAVLSGVPPASGIEADFSQYSNSRLSLWRSDSAGDFESVVALNLNNTFSDLYIYKGLVISPVLRVLLDVARSFIVFDRSLQDLLKEYSQVPLSIALVMVMLCTASALMARWFLRRTNLSIAAQRNWILICALTGLVGLTSLLFSPSGRKLPSIGKSEKFSETLGTRS